MSSHLLLSAGIALAVFSGLAESLDLDFTSGVPTGGMAHA